jgi:hypothetical protein
LAISSCCCRREPSSRVITLFSRCCWYKFRNCHTSFIKWRIQSYHYHSHTDI